jgi:ABC-type nitrate/sulfonate/bicarbonate transport system ATPase subunit
MATNANKALIEEGDVLLDVEGISLTLGGKLILSDLSLQVIDRKREGLVTGQVVSLLGASGVGKTRLLRLIAGLDLPDKGSIRGHGGKELDRSRVGYVFQDYPLLNHRSVEGNLRVAANLAGLSASDGKARVEKLLSHFRLAERRNAYPAELSGGQRQRASIAQQLVAPRTFLLMDEPFSGLDPAALQAVIELIGDTANLDDENTVLLVTHDIHASLIVSDTIFMVGRDRDGSAEGTLKDGARVVFTYDLVERGLAYQPGVADKPAFALLERELRQNFKSA